MKKKTASPVLTAQSFRRKDFDRIVRFEEAEPFEVLGPHRKGTGRGSVVNAFLPRATKAWVLGPEKQPMKKIHPGGLYQAAFPDKDAPSYKISFLDASGYEHCAEDPYQFPVAITDYDLYLMGKGELFKSYEKFGAHPGVVNGVSGVHFSVWAPNAKAVSVAGNFNHWHPGEHPMAKVHFSGVWALFVPGLKEGEVYKYAIRSAVDGQIYLKSDPYACRAELRPKTASVVADMKRYRWRDEAWMEKRRTKDPLNGPVSVYEVHLGSWKRDERNKGGFLNYKTLAKELVDYVKEMGYTHIELLPVMEHPLDISWGYQVISYYAPTSRFGTPDEFKYFVDTCHQNGIGVILDWVPAHFPKDLHGLNRFDGKQIYAYDNWKKGEHKDWGTLIFDYGRPEVRNFLISNALFWLDYYHVDGLRVDAVASMLYLDYSRKEGEWEPNQFGGRENLEAIDFLKKFNEVVHLNYPGVLTIAEESTAWPGVSRPTYLGGLGFSMKWNMGWMHDLLEYFAKDAIHRKYHQGALTFSLLYAFSENFMLPISHDEVVYGKRSLLEKMPGDDWQKFANTRLFLGFMFAHPGKKLLFMGNDIGERSEWDSEGTCRWELLDFESHRKLNRYLKDVHRFYKEQRACWEGDFETQGFEWVDFSDADNSVLSFLRWSKDRRESVLFVCNMTPVPRWNYRIGVSADGFYKEILNSDAVEYGGSGVGNFGGVHATGEAWHQHPAFLNLNLPPLAICAFRREASGEEKT